ncbi:UDP-N-acetylglucosamine 1-carboxyvinyltransferase [Candidatus Acetothermia bacterium]|nr:UDP-N-acetylglucosamine 1-carboxyvinyltransferase [Candidatus Acetothermia bacterium]
MDRLVITGGRRLIGQVSVQGAKNAALPAFAASLLTDKPVLLHRIPAISDVTTMTAMITALGKRVEVLGEGTVRIENGDSLQREAPYELVRRMRASFFVIGPLLARLGEAIVPLPGGCTIGSRPVDLHLQGLQRMGAEIEERQGIIHATAQRLQGRSIYLNYPSVGATENLIMAATLAVKETSIRNPAKEPEVLDLIAMLQKMGAQIELCDQEIRVTGVRELTGVEHEIIPDRIEAGTYLLAGGITRGTVEVKGAIANHLAALISKLQEAGVKLQIKDESITASSEGCSEAVNIVTMPYPGFSTDLQAPMAAFLTLARGTSMINETVFERRFAYVAELVRLGADIQTIGQRINITGVKRLHGTKVRTPDIRAGAALVLAGLAADGETEIEDASQIDRGYTDIVNKLAALGAQIERREEVCR